MLKWERERKRCATSLWHPLNGEIFGFCHWVEFDIFKVIVTIYGIWNFGRSVIGSRSLERWWACLPYSIGGYVTFTFPCVILGTVVQCGGEEHWHVMDAPWEQLRQPVSLERYAISMCFGVWRVCSVHQWVKLTPFLFLLRLRHWLWMIPNNESTATLCEKQAAPTIVELLQDLNAKVRLVFIHHATESWLLLQLSFAYIPTNIVIMLHMYNTISLYCRWDTWKPLSEVRNPQAIR